MENVLEKFTEKIKTKDKLDKYLEQIEEATRWIYKGGNVPLSEKIKQNVGEEFRQTIAELEESGSIPPARRAQSDFFEKLAKALESLRVVKLVLAFLPSEEFLEKMIAWLEKQTGEKAVFDISVKEEIIGGAIFEYEGEYRDYTFGSKLDSVLESEVRKLI
jgi:F0F1-type ATP synthase delta subunit